ncbi:MAG: class IV adenylate cyclase [Saprospiraceae bacterium]
MKARCANPEKVRQKLEARQARFVGTDHQVDTYFNAKTGRLKLREGTIENTLIHYHRPNQAGPKNSQVLLFKTAPNTSLKALLTAALGVRIVVDKMRRIYFVENVKIHLDEVQQLGTFLEIEAIDETGTIGLERLEEQCRFYINLFGVKDGDLVRVSYSDMMEEL